MADQETEGLRAEISRLREENRQQLNELSDLKGLIKTYREWASQCPILEIKKPASR